MRDFERGNEEEQGFALIGMVVAIFLVLLLLGLAAPKIALDLRRDREVEAMHRGNQYVRAVQLYYRKFGHYPGSVEQLDKSNNIRFLRQKYVDPMTGKADWRLIHVGEAKTTVKGFFGEPLAGIATQGLGSAAGLASTGAGAAGTVAGGGAPGAPSASGSFSFGSSAGSSFGGVGSRPGFGSSSGTAGANGVGPGAGPGVSGAGAGTGAGTGTGTGFGSQSSGSSPLTGEGGLILGVGSSASGGSILDLNEQTTYETWEFIYDPRIELLKAKATLFGGAAATGAGSLGSAQGSQSTFGSGASPGSTTGPGGSGGGTGSSPGSNGSGTTIGVPVRP